MLLVTGTEIDVAHASQQAPLGSVAYDNSGNFYRYIQNSDGANAIGKGERAMMKDSLADYQCVRATAASATDAPLMRVVGVAQQGAGIAIGQFGWVMYDGIAECASDGTTTANKAQEGAAAGRFTDFAAGSEKPVEAFATETEAPAGAGGLFTARISY